MSANVTTEGGRTIAALAVAQGRPASEVATLAGVSERTIRRWSQDAGFRKLVNAIREQLIGQTLGKLLTANEKAVDALSGLLESKFENIKLGAAGRLLDLTLRVRQQVNTEEQIARITEQLAELRLRQPSLFKRGYDDQNEEN